MKKQINYKKCCLCKKNIFLPLNINSKKLSKKWQCNDINWNPILSKFPDKETVIDLCEIDIAFGINKYRGIFNGFENII